MLKVDVGAFASMKRTSKKRKVQVFIEEDIDGEERMMLLGPPKDKKANEGRGKNKIKGDGLEMVPAERRRTTGRWRSEIHDYFPGFEYGDGSLIAEHWWRDMAKNERMGMRRELTELGEKMARVERIRRWGGRV